MNKKEEIEIFLINKLLYNRFSLSKLKEILETDVELCGNDIDACNIADYDLMCEYKGYDVDLYCLIDRRGQFYITEIGVNDQ